MGYTWTMTNQSNTSVLVHTSDAKTAAAAKIAREIELSYEMQDDEPYCFVCSRATSHYAEHDDLVGAGLAEYEGETTLKTALWDADLAAAICEASWQRYKSGAKGW